MSNRTDSNAKTGTWTTLLVCLVLAGATWSVGTYLDALNRSLEGLVRQQVEFGLEQYGTARRLSLLIQNPNLRCLVVTRAGQTVISHLPEECREESHLSVKRLNPFERQLRFSVVPDIGVTLGISLGKQAIRELVSGVAVQLLLFGLLIFLLIRSERRWLEVDRRMASLVSQVSHDLRSPIFAIKTALNGLSAGKAADSDLIQLLQLAASRVQGIAEEVIHRRRGLSPGSLESVGKLKRLIDELWPEKRMEHPQIVLENLAWLPTTNADAAVVFDTGALKRIFSNLINNSVEVGATRLQVAVESNHGAVMIVLEDNGPGFGQPAPRKREGLNLGLGLSHAKAQIKLWGGSLEIPKKGSRLRLSLPIVRPL